MPRITIHVREEDWEAFQAIQNRPEWLHNAILAQGTLMKPLQVNPKSHSPEVSPGTGGDIRGNLFILEDQSPHYEPMDEMP